MRESARNMQVLGPTHRAILVISSFFSADRSELMTEYKVGEIWRPEREREREVKHQGEEEDSGRRRVILSQSERKTERERNLSTCRRGQLVIPPLCL